MLRDVRKCTIIEAKRVTIKGKWSVSLDNLDKVIDLVIARDVIDGCLLPIKSMWTAVSGFNLFSKTMPRHKFLKIIKYLQFNQKSKRRQILLQDKFCLLSVY